MAARLAVSLLLLIPLFFSTFSYAESASSKKESWLSIYSGGERIGYSYSSTAESNGFTEVAEKEKIRVKLLESVQEIETESEYRLKSDDIVTFSFDFKSPAGDLHGSGVRNGESLDMKIKTLSGESETHLLLNGDVIPPSMLPKWLAGRGLEPGREFRVAVLDPASIVMGADAGDLTAVHKVVGKERVDIPSLGMTDAWRIDTEMLSTRYTTWITDDGEMLKQEIFPGMIALRDTKENILSSGLSDWNVTEQTSIPSNVTIDNARGIKYMKVRIEGIGPDDGFDMADGYRQFSDGDILEIKSGDISGIAAYKLPYAGNNFKSYLSPDSSSQSGDAEIIAMSAKILDGETDALKAVSKINEWVFRNLKKEGTASFPNAKDVLKTRSGDCNEHAALFAALSRAAGIPTKTVSGTIYIDGRFYYHAWNEVYVGEWIAVDPTFGQFPADASHIKFVEGDFAESSRIMNLVGKINLKILEVS